MTTVRELHDRAMELAQQAILSRHAGSFDEAKEYARQAYMYELDAANSVPNESSSEPTRSILFRSAASLAYQAQEYREAQNLIIRGLSGFPPKHVEDELNALYDQVRYEYRAQQRSVRIVDAALELTLRGNSIGYGSVPLAELFRRLDSMRSLIDRTAQRLSNARYQEHARYSPFIPIVEAPGSGSFIVTIKLEHKAQMPLFFDAQQVIDEIIQGMALINDGNDDGLRIQLDSQGYYNHFVTQVQQLAPDGRKVSLVAVASSNTYISLTRPKSEIIVPPKAQLVESARELEPISTEGVLDFANSRIKQNKRMGLTTSDGTVYEIAVTEGMEDYVRSYFEQNIRVNGNLDRAQNLIYLSSLESLEE